AGEALVEGEDPEGEDEQAGDDGRDAGHDVDEEPHRSGQPAAAVLDDIDRGDDPERDGDDAGYEHLLDGPHDGVVDAAVGVEGSDTAHRGGEEVAVDRAQA